MKLRQARKLYRAYLCGWSFPDSRRYIYNHRTWIRMRKRLRKARDPETLRGALL